MEEVVIDTFNGGRISTHLTNQIYPPIHQGEFFHYTSISATQSILNSRKVRLNSIQNRIDEDEIREFLEKFDYDYPLGIDEASRKPRYIQSIANDFFYISMTDNKLTDKEDKYFWKKFAGMNGSRLKFRIKIQSGCMRRMIYGKDIDKWADFYREVKALTLKKLKKQFFWEGAATVCALYLPFGYHHEKETRLVIKRSWGLQEMNDGNMNFVELQFGYNQSTAITLELIEIQTDQKIDVHYKSITVPRI